MTAELADWPPLPSPAERKAAREREKAFLSAMKAQARTRGWRYAGGFVFRQDGGWFACIMPGLRHEGGVALALELKPMTLDSLFWEITGLSENESLPLSIRANGAWALQGPEAVAATIGEDVSDINTLAGLAMDWADAAFARTRGTRSIQQMLTAVLKEADLTDRRLALAICLHILAEDLEAALALCQPSSPDSTFLDESGGFLTSAPDGTLMTFLDQARSWIAAKRRAALKLV